MRVLGVDPGTATVGYGVVDETDDGDLVAVEYGVITTPAKMPMHQRLSIIYDELSRIIEKTKPDRAGVEELFFAKNVTTAITVAQGRGVILLTLAQAGLTIREYKPHQVKQSISGYGAAGKPQMQEMVRMLLNLEKIPRPDDAADGLAIAITDIHSARLGDLAENGYDS
jgi:crossover junction endodeoxyribonuclease RuvC